MASRPQKPRNQQKLARGRRARARCSPRHPPIFARPGPPWDVAPGHVAARLYTRFGTWGGAARASLAEVGRMSPAPTVCETLQDLSVRAALRCCGVSDRACPPTPLIITSSWWPIPFFSFSPSLSLSRNALESDHGRRAAADTRACTATSTWIAHRSEPRSVRSRCIQVPRCSHGSARSRSEAGRNKARDSPPAPRRANAPVSTAGARPKAGPSPCGPALRA